MSILVLLSAVLSAVFVFSGWQKFRAPESARSAATDLGVSSALVRRGLYPLCAGEFALAAGLMVTSSHMIAAWLSLGLLVSLTALLAANLVRGNRPACSCFGARSQRPIGASTIARNVALTAVAATLVIDPAELAVPIGPILSGHISLPWVISVIALVLAAASLYLAIAVLRRHGALVLRIESLEQRTSFSDVKFEFEEESIDQDLANAGLRDSLTAEHIDLVDLVATGSASMLLFLDSGCAGCRDVLPTLESGELSSADIVVASNSSLPALQGVRTARYDDPGLPWRLGCGGIPCLVPLDPVGQHVGQPHLGRDAVLAALTEHVRDSIPVGR